MNTVLTYEEHQPGNGSNSNVRTEQDFDSGWVTADNGKEFSGHADIARVLETAFYFAHPYSPWERGTNENANGLVRQYFPKGSDFSTITQSELDHVMERLNNRPRKCLGMLTPHQVLCGIKHGVALAS